VRLGSENGLTVQIMVVAQEGDTIQGRTREVVCSFAAEFAREHAIEVVVGGFGEIGLRGCHCGEMWARVRMECLGLEKFLRYNGGKEEIGERRGCGDGTPDIISSVRGGLVAGFRPL
jgi:hypothetical protein